MSGFPKADVGCRERAMQLVVFELHPPAGVRSFLLFDRCGPLLKDRTILTRGEADFSGPDSLRSELSREPNGRNACPKSLSSRRAATKRGWPSSKTIRS